MSEIDFGILTGRAFTVAVGAAAAVLCIAAGVRLGIGWFTQDSKATIERTITERVTETCDCVCREDKP